VITEPYMGLKIWNNLTDPYDHAQLADNWAKVAQHDHSGNKGLQIPTGGIQDGAITQAKLGTGLTATPSDASVTTAKLTAGAVTADILADAIKLGLTDSGTVRRGKSIIATTETRTNTVYGTMPTPDQVSVTLPTDGLIAIAYQATWQESVNATAAAAIFLGANQLKVGTSAGLSAVSEAQLGGGTAAVDKPLATTGVGLLGTGSGPTAYSGDVTTGQILGRSDGGGPTYVFAAAGTYVVSVQFKSTSGTVTVKNRKLWALTIGF
jgi:hypothetical protein